MSVDTDVLVVGAGIVGLATARELQARLGTHVTVLEKDDAPARHQSGRNSGVVHSGLYYEPRSAKARLVARGRRMLTERAADWGVPVERIGKLVVATRVGELDGLAELERRAHANGVAVAPMRPAEFQRIEPRVAGVAALHVPDAAITDFAAVTNALARELQADGAELRFGTKVLGVEASDELVRTATSEGAITSRWLVNCAGLHSDRVARAAGVHTDVRIVPFRGEYRQLSPFAREVVRGLVYPVPDVRWPFLGVHFTPMLDGSVKVGPSAVLALAREAYVRGVDLRDVAELMATRGLRHLARTYWRTGAAEMARSRSRSRFLADVRQLVPELGAADLVDAPAGVRAQAISPDGRLLDDFAFGSSRRAVHVLNAPSPAATAALAIGEVVADRVAEMRDGSR